jgi:hypothetical protein
MVFYDYDRLAIKLKVRIVRSVVEGERTALTGSKRDFLWCLNVSLDGCVASTVFKDFPDSFEMLEGPPIGHFTKIIKHAACLICRRCNTSGWPAMPM